MDLTLKIRGAVVVMQHTKKDHNKITLHNCTVQRSHTCWGDSLLYHTTHTHTHTHTGLNCQINPFSNNATSHLLAL